MAHRCVADNISVSCRSLAVQGERAVTIGAQPPSETAHLGEVPEPYHRSAATSDSAAMWIGRCQDCDAAAEVALITLL